MMADNLPEHGDTKVMAHSSDGRQLASLQVVVPRPPPPTPAAGNPTVARPWPIGPIDAGGVLQSVWSHWLTAGVVLLAMAALTLGAAVGLEVAPGGEKVLVGPRGWPLPQLCMWRTLLGRRCPGCGLTRSVVTFLHGDYARAFLYHPLGPLVLLAAWGWAGWTFVRRSGEVLDQLWKHKRRRRPISSGI